VKEKSFALDLMKEDLATNEKKCKRRIKIKIKWISLEKV